MWPDVQTHFRASRRISWWMLWEEPARDTPVRYAIGFKSCVFRAPSQTRAVLYTYINLTGLGQEGTATWDL